ncbi:flagellar hook protein FlgE [Nocardioides sp. Iso805N]|uniref:flagellar hook protein FlgE n=1 Tax=Nocardioides sp. Iso805N TaxID=1283287 RepID=UPI00037473D4|nr:flagellar hook-basal body complex protein [Nocardioides sp. Iso805N]
MLRSLFAGISGLRVNQTMLDVTGNNIANANTVGFKSSQTVFSDTLSQMLTAASAPANNGSLGGTNAIQIGLGTQLAAVKTNFTQGANETTGVPTDMMLSGDGFFVVSDGANKYLTRAGAFSFDQNGNLTAPDGKLVQGYAVTSYNADGTPNYDSKPGATDTTGTGLETITQQMNDKVTAPATTNGLQDYFDAEGAAATPPVVYSTTPGTPAGSVAYPNLQSYEIGSDGTITGTYSNGDKLAIGKIGVANVQNPQGLEKSGDSEYVSSANSGLIEYAAAGEVTDYGQNAKITTGALEMSNVDLSTEFTNLILAQRGFEASSKIITTSDQILDDLINMKR